MTDYTPKPGDEVWLTVRATVTNRGESYQVPEATLTHTDESAAWISSKNPDIVRVEPALRDLPTEYGALILAHIGGGSDAPVLLALGQHDEEAAWFYSGFMSAGPVYVTEIGSDWVRIDPDTLRPIED